MIDAERPGNGTGTTRDNPTGRVSRNAVASGVGFAVQAGVTFVLIPALVGGLGDEGYGTWSLLQAAVAYLMLLELNVSDAVIRYTARYRQTDDHAAAQGLASTAFVALATAGVAAALVTAAVYLVELPLGVPPHLASEARQALAILGAGVAVSLPLRLFPAHLEGLGKYATLNTVESVVAMARAALLIWAATRGEGIVGMATIVAATLVGQGLVMAWLSRLTRPPVRIRLAAVDRSTLAGIAAYASPAFAILVASQVSLHADAFVIGALMTPASIAYFVVAAGLVDQLRRALGSIVAVLTPAVSALDAGAAHQIIATTFLRFGAGLVAVAIPAVIAAWLMGRQFLSLWLGPEYAAASYPVLVVLTASLPWFVVQSAAARVLFGLGKLGFLARISVAEAIANVLLSIVLVRYFGITGVAVGTALPVIAQGTATAAYTCNQLGLSRRRAIRALVGPAVRVVPIPAAVWWVAASSLPLDTWMSFVLTAGVGTLLGGLLAWRVLFRQER